MIDEIRTLIEELFEKSKEKTLSWEVSSPTTISIRLGDGLFMVRRMEGAVYESKILLKSRVLIAEINKFDEIYEKVHSLFSEGHPLSDRNFERSFKTMTDAIADI